MTYEMTLLNEYFLLVKNGLKNIEYRLYDEKRRKLKIGDYILFKNANNKGDAILVKIINLKIYDNLLLMYKDNFDNDLSKNYETPEDVLAATTYYTEEEKLTSMALAIYFEIA